MDQWSLVRITNTMAGAGITAWQDLPTPSTTKLMTINEKNSFFITIKRDSFLEKDLYK